MGRSDGFSDRVIELHLGLNRLGRSPENDFTSIIPRFPPGIVNCTSAGEEITVSDCESTNGTFLNGKPIQKSVLQQGQTLCLGEVELFVDSIEIRVAIPKFDMPRPRLPWCNPMVR